MEKIIVIIRETFPTNEKLTEENLKNKYIINPYDEYALLQAKKIKSIKEIEIVAIFISKRESQYNLRTALALGADKGIFIRYNVDNITELAKKIARELSKISYKYIFIGNKDVNNDREELPSRLANFLEENIFSHVISFDGVNPDIIKIERDKNIDTLEISGKAIVAFNKNVYEPEYPSIDAIMGVSSKEVKSIYYELNDNNIVREIEYQSIYRKKDIRKNISVEDGVELIVEYLKKWKIID